MANSNDRTLIQKATEALKFRKPGKEASHDDAADAARYGILGGPVFAPAAQRQMEMDLQNQGMNDADMFAAARRTMERDTKFQALQFEQERLARRAAQEQEQQRAMQLMEPLIRRLDTLEKKLDRLADMVAGNAMGFYFDED